MKPISCIITDDEPFARAGLKRYAEQFPVLNLIAVCEDAAQLRACLQNEKVDLLFLDIEMPLTSGISFLKSLEAPPRVIFTTAFEEYALQSFDFNVLDYLLKPISFERFSRSVEKAVQHFAASQSPNPDSCFIKVDGRLEKIFFEEILYIEGLENYAAVYTTRGKMITHATLKSFKQDLPDFIQPHKSYLVNAHHITSFQGAWLFCGLHKIPVSRYQKKEIQRAVLRPR